MTTTEAVQLVLNEAMRSANRMQDGGFPYVGDRERFNRICEAQILLYDRNFEEAS